MKVDIKSLMRYIMISLLGLAVFTVIGWLMEFRLQVRFPNLVAGNAYLLVLGLYLIINHKKFGHSDRMMFICVFPVLILEYFFWMHGNGHLWSQVERAVFWSGSSAYFAFVIAMTFIPSIQQWYRIRLNESMTRDLYSPLIEKLIKMDAETGVLEAEVEARERNKEDVAYIFEIMNDVNTRNGTGEVLNIIKDVFLSRVKVDNLAVVLRTSDKMMAKEGERVTLFHNLDPVMMKYLRFVEGNSAHTFTFSNLPLYTLRVADDWTEMEDTDKIPYEFFILIPFYMHKTNRGFLGFFLKNAAELNQARLQFATFAVHELSLALNKLLLFEKLKTLSTQDGLTKLYLHRIFEEKLDDEFKRAKRYGKKLSLLMMDIDHFKRFNDDFGHLTGDKVLARVGEHMLKSVEKDMLPARYGGEEFAVICPEHADMEAYARGIKKAIQEDFVKSDKGEKLKITVSIGIADISPEMHDFTVLVKKADDSLYHAKKNGRDLIVYYPERMIKD